MQTLLTSVQMRRADANTIHKQSILSRDLMERAAKAFIKEFKNEVIDRSARIAIFCGQGNNGGDGLAIARLLDGEAYKNVTVYFLKFYKKNSAEVEENLKRLSLTDVPLV